MKCIYRNAFILLAFASLTFPSCNKSSSGPDGQGSLPGQWQQTNGPCNGSIGSMAITGTAILTGWDGLYITNDLGISWEHVQFGSSIYTTPGEFCVRNDTIIGACFDCRRSVDNGKTWTPLADDLSLSELKSLSWSGNRILICTGYWGKLNLSEDNGESWTTCPEHVPDLYVTGATILGQDIFVASGGSRIYKSTDKGQTYSLTNSGLTDTRVFCVEAHQGNIYAGTATGIYRSSDYGDSWIKLSSTSLDGQPVSHLAFDGQNIIAGGYNGLFISTDGGTLWTKAENGIVDNRIHSVALKGSTWLAGTVSGVYMSSDNGQSWKAIGLPVTFVRSLVPNGSDVFACASEVTGGIFVTSDQGSTWDYLRGGLPTNDVTSIAWNGAEMLAATDMGVFVSSDRGQTWTQKSSGIPEMNEYNSLTCVAGNGDHLFAGTYSTGLYVSHDRGESWSKAILPIEDMYYAMSLFIDGPRIFAGTFCAGIICSTDNGTTWSAVNVGLPTTIVVTSFARTGSRLLIGSSAGIYASDNNGQSWNPAGTALMGKVVYGLTEYNGDLFAATSQDGVYMSVNKGTSWSQVNTGFPAGIQAYCVAVNGSWLYAGTQGMGVWRHPL